MNYAGDNMMQRGTLFVVSGPSAVGKSTVVERVLQINPALVRIVTCTTRIMRIGEQNGRDYIFLDKEDFLSRIKRNEFIEFSEVYGNYYGVLLSTIQEAIASGSNAILVINWEGFLKIKQTLQDKVVGIFINPPSVATLEERIRSRGTDSPEAMQRRLNLAQQDMQHANIYDICFINREIEETAQQIVKYINESTYHEIS